MRSVLSPQERNVSAEGAKAEEHAEQLSRVARPTGIGTRKALPRGLDHPAKTFIGRHASATGDLGTQEHPQPTESCSVPDLPSLSPSRKGASPESGSADLERDALVEGAVRHGDLAASKEGSERLVSSAPGPKPDTPEEEGLQGSIPAPKPRLSNWWTKEGSWESSAELLVPVSPKEVTPSTPHVPQGTASPAADWEQDRDAHATEVSPLRPPSPPIVLEEPSLSSAPDGFCDGAGTLKEDLEVCEAVVLHQSAPNGCLLPEKTLDAEGRVAEREGTSYQRPEQQWDVDALRTRFANHALLLRTHGAQLPEEAAALFDSLQDPGGKVLEDQALPALGEVLLGDHVARSSPQSNESSYSSLFIPNGGGERKEAERAPWLADTGEQGWDSSDDSCQGKRSQETHSESGSSWSERSPVFSRTETRKGMAAAIKSKAFWGESDDSCSEIEAALCPPAHSTEADEFDDFYD